MADDIPQWAKEKAIALANEGDWHAEPILFNAFARYIASKEQAPDDPLRAALREAFPISFPAESNRPSAGDVKALRRRLAELGLKIVSSDA